MWTLYCLGHVKTPMAARLQHMMQDLRGYQFHTLYYTFIMPYVGLLSVRVEFAGSKIAITTANFGGLKKLLYPIAALKLGFMMICAISPYSIPVKS